MNRTAFKAAASTLIVTMTMTGFSGQSGALRRFNEPDRATSRSDRQAAQLHAQAAQALRSGQLDAARTAIEQAVALSPRDAGYRQLLADIYLKSGRFTSARTTYGDVLELDPSNVRAALSIALIQIAQGNPRAAVARLDDLAGRAPAADVGLAYALAGAGDRAVALLEDAARAPGATPRTRQNLALAYAIAGDWRRARAVAAQDLSPAELPARMEQWAAFARPGAGATQVASLLGVSPAEDSGQPVRLALAPEAAPAPQAFAAVEAPPAPVETAATAPVAAPAPAPQAPVRVAEAAPVEAPAFWVPSAQSYQAPVEVPIEDAAPPAAPAPEVRAQYAAAAQSLVRPEPALIRAAAVTRVPATPFQRARPQLSVRHGSAPVVVQLGAFSNEANAERAWLQAARRFGLADRRPLTTTIDLNGRHLHRVSVSGFASAGDAQRLCGRIREQGGACFVRGQAGDASIRWAARYANPRQRNA
ncbi:MAG TPA: SPOR domain-containing protein [Allosphingosinicella sp.]|nr:SPOR domain-containing protein [Allosphingosinicella sp.]